MLRNIYNTAASCTFFNSRQKKCGLVTVVLTSSLGAWQGYAFASPNGYSLPAFTIVYAALGGISGAAGCYLTATDIPSVLNKEMPVWKSLFKNFASTSAIGFTIGAFAGLGVSLEIADKYDFSIANILAYSTVHGVNGGLMGMANGVIGVLGGTIPTMFPPSTPPHNNSLNNEESSTLVMRP